MAMAERLRASPPWEDAAAAAIPAPPIRPAATMVRRESNEALKVTESLLSGLRQSAQEEAPRGIGRQTKNIT